MNHKTNLANQASLVHLKNYDQHIIGNIQPQRINIV